jgi:hypothetical protein
MMRMHEAVADLGRWQMAVMADGSGRWQMADGRQMVMADGR